MNQRPTNSDSEGRVDGAAASTWTPPPSDPSLDNDEVHVWRASLELSASQVQCLHHTLPPDEQARAEQFRFRKGREHFVAARGLLREILARYLDAEPAALQFRYGPQGKPALAGEHAAHPIRFNLSHSHGLALYAITRDREIGIDLEHIREHTDDEGIARRFFSPRELETLLSLPPEARQEAFFNCWTRKEAFIKAVGEGLSLPLNQFDVSLAPGEEPALLAVRGNAEEASRWSLRQLTPGDGFVAALAVEGRDLRLQCWEWRDNPSL